MSFIFTLRNKYSFNICTSIVHCTLYNAELYIVDVQCTVDKIVHVIFNAI